MQKRPKLVIKLTPFDIFLEILALVGILFSLSICIYYGHSLPERIPTHFALDGSPDGYGSKNTIWFLVILIGIMYSFFSIISRFPESFNYLTEITQENAYNSYQKALRLLRLVKVWAVAVLAYINWVVIQIALGNYQGMNPRFDVIVIVSVIVMIVYIAYHGKKN